MQVLLEETGGFSPAMRSAVKHHPDLLQERGEVVLRLGQGSDSAPVGAGQRRREDPLRVSTADPWEQ